MVVEDNAERTWAAAATDVIRQVCHEELNVQGRGPQVKDRAADFVVGGVGEGAQVDQLFFYVIGLLGQHGDAGIQRINDAEERLSDRIMNIAGDAVAFGFDGEASGAVNA